MSGIDEQYYYFTECPECHEAPRYWTIRDISGKRIWFRSREHALSDEEFGGRVIKFTRSVRGFEDFDSVVYVWCPGCSRKFDQIEYGSLVDRVLQTAKTFYKRGPIYERD